MILLFLTLWFGSICYAAYLGTRWHAAGQFHNVIIAEFNRDVDVCDAADMATDGAE